MPKTVLVTGVAGFIGSHLAERLLELGCRVVGVDNFSDFYSRSVKQSNLNEIKARGGEFKLCEVDIRDASAVLEVVRESKPDTIFHLAAMAGVRPSIENPSLYAEVNVVGTTHVLNAATACRVKKVIFASSSSVYGENKKVPFAENDRVDFPISPYAATKRSGELLCHTHSLVHGTPITCLRFFTVYGPRQRPDLAIHKFMNAISRSEPVTLFGDGTTSRDYTYISDIIDGVQLAWERCDGFHIYNLGGNLPVSLSDLVSHIERTVGRDAKIKRLPMQPGDVVRTYADLTRSSEDLEYRPKVALEEGLAQQWRWLQTP